MREALRRLAEKERGQGPGIHFELLPFFVEFEPDLLARAHDLARVKLAYRGVLARAHLQHFVGREALAPSGRRLGQRWRSGHEQIHRRRRHE
jgi:hypothetical protein